MSCFQANAGSLRTAHSRSILREANTDCGSASEMLPNVHSLSDSENALSRRLTHSAEASLTQKLLKPPTKGTLTTTHNKAHLHSPHVLQCLPAPPPLKGGFYMYHFHIIKDIKLDSRNIFFIFFLQKKKSSPLPSPTAPMFLISLSYLKVLSKV